MKLLRIIIGTILKILNNLFLPSAEPISDEQRKLIVQQVQGLELYVFPMCPFCIKVTRFMKRKNIELSIRDARNDEFYRKELGEEAGKLMAPCLKIINDSGTNWLYESDDIIKYLAKRIS